ncbi:MULTISPECIES: DUF5134 domain-containing protein [Streptomyces]|uniref:DUF5134 domain-containing protein n=2 Tax=Streptomyces TaxID=1883 RepID=A0ABV9IMC3_9ACTN
MSAADAVYCMLTALFAVAAVLALRYAILPPGSGWRSRVDHLLHTAMALSMAVMPWRWDGRPAGAETAFFAAAALWFPLTAVIGRRKSGLTDIARTLPYSAGMAAMAWMTHLTTGPSYQAVHLDHAMGSRTEDVVTGVLALYLLACALRTLTLDMPTLHGTSGAVDVSTSIEGPCTRFWHGSMALGTAVMLLMHH